VKFATKPCNIAHLILGMLPHYLRISKVQIFCKYSADMGKMQTNCIFSAPIFIPLYACNCVCWVSLCVLSKSRHRRWIPCWLLTNTALSSALTNFRCHRLIAKVK